MKKLNMRVVVATLIASILIPIFNIVVLGSIRIESASNVIFPLIVSEIVKYATWIIDIACLFAAYACVGYAYAERRSRLTASLIVVASIPIAYLASGILDAVYFGKNAISASYIAYSLNSGVFELIRFGCLLLVQALVAKQKATESNKSRLELLSVNGRLSKMCVAGTVVTALFMFLSTAFETATLLLEYGAPVNFTETVSLISPYITTTIFVILGYFLTYAVMKLLVRINRVLE